MKTARAVDLPPLQPLPYGESSQRQSLEVREPKHAVRDLVLEAATVRALNQVLLEHHHADELVANGCSPATKILLVGPPGTGKTSAAGALAKALGLPFMVARQHELVNSHMGESDKAIARLFDYARTERAVYLLDEIDGIASKRGDTTSGADKAQNSMLTTILSMLDLHTGPGIVLAATNRPEVIDDAAFRRFDLVIQFDYPDEAARETLIARTLGATDWWPTVGNAFSHADIVRECLVEKKRRVLAAIAARGDKP